MSIKLRVGGVPEHFNLPWHLSIEAGKFKEAGIDIQWETFHGGTGAMCKALANDETDIAIVLTEGMVNAVINGNPSKILQQYVRSPLIWGIHTSAKNESRDINDYQNDQYAISRFGSGSHIMAYVNAADRGWKINKEQFNVVGKLDGALDSLDKKESQLFLWEKFTTKPYVDSGQLARIGETLTPWPCFVMAASDKAINNHKEALLEVMQILNTACAEFMSRPDAIPLVSKRYNLEEQDVTQWFNQTEWNTDNFISERILDNVMQTLLRTGVLEKTVPAKDLCSEITRFSALKK